MESNRGETNSKPLVNLGEEKKKSFTSFIMDASIMVLIFTGLTYLLGMKFKEGYLGYYKITNITLSDVGMNYIINSVSYILILLIFWGLIYIIYLPILFIAKRKSKVFHFIILLFALFAGIWVLCMYVFNVIIDEEFFVLIGIISSSISLLDVVFTSLKKHMIEGRISSNGKIIKFVQETLVPFISDIKKNRYLKYVLLIPCIYFAIIVFLHLGENAAREREEYLIIEHGKSDYAVITESSNNLLIAKVDIDKKVIYANYSIIEAKSEFNELVKLKSKKINGGLKVKRVKVK